MSGGGGYVMSSRALHDVMNIGFKKGSCKGDGGDEDVEIGKCLEVSSNLLFWVNYFAVLFIKSQ